LPESSSPDLTQSPSIPSWRKSIPSLPHLNTKSCLQSNVHADASENSVGSEVFAAEYGQTVSCGLHIVFGAVKALKKKLRKSYINYESFISWTRAFTPTPKTLKIPYSWM
jgi:hypothetical protein